MSQAKKQHYVPKFYLKNFSINSNRKTIQCLDKVNLRSHISNFKVIAQEEKFNESDSQDIEDNLSKIENDASKLINNFLDNPKYKRLNSEPFKLKLAYFILIQLIRTKEVRNRPIDFSLCILDPFCYSNFKEYKEFDILDGFNNIKKAGLSKITDINDVKFVNSLQIKYSTEYVFSCENEFEENGKIKQWICDVIEESSNESKVKTEEVKTNLDGKLFRQHYS